MKDKVVVVTGAASGIGAAVCRRFSRDGAKIGLIDRDADGVQAAADKLRSVGVDALGLKCDVVAEAECNTAIREVIRHYGGIDILVNNAGITQRSAFLETKVSVYRQVMDVNFFGALHCTRAAVDSLIERRGSIIVIESLAGVTPLLGRTGYCASKHALHGFFTSLRAELRDTGLHIMIVCPGFVKTNLQTRALDGDGRVTSHPQSLVGKPASPEKIADAILKGTLRRRKLLILTPVGKLSYLISRFAPVLYESLMARQVQEELNR
ncbi:MAG: SDR family oxidoreductase [Desulfobacterales bacterium]|jgi:NAD(P)-dependent dehydrogenase (short-subunit alcohol dehydrogenase family)